MKFLFLLFLVLLNFVNLQAQKKMVGTLPSKLKEISGLAFLNDSILVAHNDGGHDPELFFLNLLGEKIHKVTVENAENKDWEDITIDSKGFIYIGDIGNNNNNRKDLCIYKVNSKDILKKEIVKAEKISFTYPDQKEFPPSDDKLHFDAEGMAFYKDSLYIFTKCRAEPFDGKTFTYTVPSKSGTYVAFKGIEYVLGKGGWWKDAITGLEIKNDKCYILTYNRLIIYSFSHKKLEFIQEIMLGKISQKESVAVNSKGAIYVADEKHKVLGGGNLYKITIPKKK
ncbi:MAG: hypothetical protein HYR91_04620 [Flavobacteriia bacterium]|nr:hypothetical protein [Flavobacteriia bacterium]